MNDRELYGKYAVLGPDKKFYWYEVCVLSDGSVLVNKEYGDDISEEEAKEICETFFPSVGYYEGFCEENHFQLRMIYKNKETLCSLTVRGEAVSDYSMHEEEAVVLYRQYFSNEPDRRFGISTFPSSEKSGELYAFAVQMRVNMLSAISKAKELCKKYDVAFVAGLCVTETPGEGIYFMREPAIPVTATRLEEEVER